MKAIFILLLSLVMFTFVQADNGPKVDLSKADSFYNIDYSTLMGDGGSGGSVGKLVRVDAVDIYQHIDLIHDLPSFLSFIFKGDQLRKTDCRNVASNIYMYSIAQEIYLRDILRYEMIKGQVINSDDIFYYYVDATKILDYLNSHDKSDGTLLPFKFDALVAIELKDKRIFYREDIKNIFSR